MSDSPVPHRPRSSRSPRLRDHLDPTLIRQVRRVSRVWFGAFVAAAAVTTASVAQLKAPVWIVIAGGRFTGATLVLVVAIMASGELTQPDRAWPMLLVIVIAAVGAPYVAALVTGAILQLGHPVLAAAAASRLLAGTADSVSRLALVAGVISLVVVPGVLAALRESRRRKVGSAAPR